jgi:hypothetical protein
MKNLQTIHGRPARGLGLRLDPATYDALDRAVQERREAGPVPHSFGVATIAREVLDGWAAEQRRTRSAA